MRLLLVLISCAMLALPACGGLQSELADPSPREGDELQAREWHDRVVRLEGEASLSAQREDPCPDSCAIASRACELTAQICGLADGDSTDEGTRMLCEDAQPRCDAARGQARARCPECQP